MDLDLLIFEEDFVDMTKMIKLNLNERLKSRFLQVVIIVQFVDEFHEFFLLLLDLSLINFYIVVVSNLIEISMLVFDF
jgi:hypothetical protein